MSLRSLSKDDLLQPPMKPGHCLALSKDAFRRTLKGGWLRHSRKCDRLPVLLTAARHWRLCPLAFQLLMPTDAYRSFPP